MPRVSEISKTNMGFVMALVGFDLAILVILLTPSVPWSWMTEFISGLLVVSIFSLTFAFFVYHTTLATEQDVNTPRNAERLIRKGNRWTEIGLFSLISTVPLFLWETGYYVAFGVSIAGFIWVTYHFVRRTI